MGQYQVEFEMHTPQAKPRLTVNMCVFDAESDQAAILRASSLVAETDVIIDVVRLNRGCGAPVWEARLEDR